MADWFPDVDVFAAYYRAGQWSVVAPVVSELSGRRGFAGSLGYRNEVFGGIDRRPGAIISFHAIRRGAALSKRSSRSSDPLIPLRSLRLSLRLWPDLLRLGIHLALEQSATISYRADTRWERANRARLKSRPS
jgi:hypothetical protein